MSTEQTPKEQAYAYLEGFELNYKEEDVHRLADYSKAPKSPGVYEIGLGAGAGFRAYYIGRSKNMYTRLSRHYANSSNKQIKERRQNKEMLYFRCTKVDLEKQTLQAVRVIEGLYLIADREKYEWIGRQEWTQHLALEDFE